MQTKYFVLLNNGQEMGRLDEAPALTSWQGWTSKTEGIREDILPHNLPPEKTMPTATHLLAMERLEHGQITSLANLPGRVRRMTPDPRVTGYVPTFRFANPMGRIVDRRV